MVCSLTFPPLPILLRTQQSRCQANQWRDPLQRGRIRHDICDTHMLNRRWRAANSLESGTPSAEGPACMGLLRLLTFPVSGPIAGTKWALQTLLNEAERRYYDEAAIRQEMAE